MKPHIVVGGGLHPDGLKLMEAEARVTLVSDSETEAGMVAAAKDAAGILFRSKPLCSRSLMAALPNLKVIGRHGVGLDIVDLPAATDLGVAVVHAPGSNSQLGGRARHHAHARLRQAGGGGGPAHAQGGLGQGAVGVAPRDGRQDPRHHRRGQYRPAGGEDGGGARHEGDRLRQVRARRRAPEPRGGADAGSGLGAARRSTW